MLVCTQSVAPILRSPDPQSERLSDLLFGEAFAIRHEQGAWAFGAGPDGTEGCVALASLAAPSGAATHRVRRGVVQRFDEPALTRTSGVLLPLNARVRLTGATAAIRYPGGGPGSIVVELESGGWVTQQGLAPIDEPERDLRAVAEGLVGGAYLHGGKTWIGLDGPGFVHTVLAACGLAVPRALDAQRAFIAESKLTVGAEPVSVTHADGACGFAFADGQAIVVSLAQMAVVRTPMDRVADR